MIKLLPIILFCLMLSLANAQGEKTYFSEAISLNINSYKKKVSKAYI